MHRRREQKQALVARAEAFAAQQRRLQEEHIIKTGAAVEAAVEAVHQEHLDVLEVKEMELATMVQQ